MCVIIMCRYAVLGAGFAGLSVTWHLLQVLLPSLLSNILYICLCAFIIYVYKYILLCDSRLSSSEQEIF